MIDMPYKLQGINRSMNILKNFSEEYELGKIVDLLIDKGPTVLDSYTSEEYTNVTNENCDLPIPKDKACNMKTIEIFNNLGMTKKTQNVFSKEIVLLKKIKNLQRALYIFVSPNSIIPNHVDDEDECFRMVTGVLTPDNIGLVLDDEPVQLKKSQTIGFSAPEVWHYGWNNSNQYWSMLTLCIKDKKFDGIRKIY